MTRSPLLASVLFSIAVPLFVDAAAAETATPPLRFKEARGSRPLVLRQCPLLPGADSFVVSAQGGAIAPRAGGSRDVLDLEEQFRFFSCAHVNGVPTLLAKQTRTGAVIEHTFTAADFARRARRRSGLSKVCPKGTQSVSGGVLYKPEADAADGRRGKPAFLLQGSQKNRASALRVFASDGTEVCKFTFKASSIPGVNGGSDHYFSGWSGGCGKTGSQIAAAARSASGSSNVFIESKGGRCFGPVNPTSRVGGIS